MELELDGMAWQGIVDSVYNGILVINRNGIVVVYNKSAAEILGIPVIKALGARVEDLIPNTRLVEVMEKALIETNQRLDLGNRVIISNRCPIWQGSAVIGAVAIFQDISDFEALSGQLDTVKAVNKELDAVIESVDDGIVVADSNCMIVRANNAYQRMTGITAREFVGKHVRDLLKQGYMNTSVTELVLQRKSLVNVIDVRNGKDLLLTGTPVYDEVGNISHVVTAIRDVTVLSNLKEQLAESEVMRDRYFRELEHLRSKQSFRKIITKNPEMEKKLELAYHVANVDSTVLLLGESGVGKELIADLIHRAGRRGNYPLIKINCGAVPQNLLESEFFGYEPGAFTGALKEGKPGLFELAQGGTLFLDEVGELALDLQVKVLRAIQDKEITRISGKKPVKLDVRIIAATNRDLESMVKEKLFREDLYYRLNVVPIKIPPLRERSEDIFPLVAEFLSIFNARHGFRKWIHPDVMGILLDYDWPGNIRELENTIERLVVIARKDCIDLEDIEDLSLPLLRRKQAGSEVLTLQDYLESEEKRLISDAYKTTGSTRKAAKLLGISQPNLVKKLKKYGITK
ncbi:MAG: sigma 54-interacting transcriptional regulator [Desulfitobacterium hafniense]|nr:sigma 54-interacting transcriptional regulator [Desulfitobacterium hafniense]